MLTIATIGWASWSVSGQGYEEQVGGIFIGGHMADIGRWTPVGNILVHAMRLSPSQARYPHFQGQVFEYG